jgi:hypothetical protein
VGQDIELCDMAIRHAGDRIAPSWRAALLVLGGVRRWLFLPTLVMVIPMLVMYKGGDALNVCFNSVAVLFLCEIDNLGYAILLPERERVRIEEEGRVELGEAEARSLVRSKVVHVCVLMLLLPSTVAIGLSGDESLEWGVFVPLATFWTAGVAEAIIGDEASAVEICTEVGKVTGRGLLGMLGWSLVFIVAYGMD